MLFFYVMKIHPCVYSPVVICVPRTAKQGVVFGVSSVIACAACQELNGQRLLLFTSPMKT